MKNKKDLLDALDDPDSLSQEELDAILNDPNEQEDARLLGNYRQAFVRRHASLKPDVNKEWNNFRQSKISSRSKGKQLWVGITIGVAASVFLFLGWQMFHQIPLQSPVNQPIVAFTASTQSQEVLLSTGDGRMVSLSAPQADSLLRETGITRGEEELDYQQTIRETEIHTLTTPRCGAYQLRLADGTQVWLNAETEIRYPVQFTGDKRVVYLDGEAYFTVAPDKNKPFTVVSTHASVSVLGTQFNFRAYPDERDVQTTLVSGSVIMQSEKYKQQIKLVPGEQGVLEKNSAKLMKQEVNTYLYTAWKDGRFAFRDARLEDLFNILARWYDLSVFYQSPEAKDIRFTGDLNKTDHFKSILKIIEQNERVIFTVNQRTVFIQAK